MFLSKALDFKTAKLIKMEITDGIAAPGGRDHRASPRRTRRPARDQPARAGRAWRSPVLAGADR